MTEISEKSRVAIIGSGSWATALAKLMMYNVNEINWYIRNKENIELFKKFRHNPNYLRSVEFDVSKSISTTISTRLLKIQIFWFS